MARRRKRSKASRGVRPWKQNLQAYVRVNGTLYSKTFASDTPLEQLTAWRTLQRTLHGGRGKAKRGSFAADVAAYLKRIAAMPTAGQREQHLELWLEALGRDRARYSIKAAEIDEVMQRWTEQKLAADTIRKRRTSLLALFHRLDGKDAPNPVRGSHPPKPARAHVRGLPFPTLLRVLDSMPPSDTAARLRVLAWTGLPPGMLMKVTASDIDFEKGELRVSPRRKGHGSSARTVPLTAQAVDAFRELERRGAFGDFAIAAAGRCLHRACKRCDVAPIRLYDIRHSFGALLYKTTRDLPTVARFLLHASLTSTARYAMGAVDDVDRRAVEQLGKDFTV